jgi:hypothetical protein
MNVPMGSQSRIFWRLALIIQVNEDDHRAGICLSECSKCNAEAEEDEDEAETESKRGDSNGCPIEAAMQLLMMRRGG